MTELYIRETEEAGSPAAHALLEEILARDFGVAGPKMQKGPHGKPCLETGPQFNLSHTKGAVAAAISDRPVGVDLERVRDFLPSLPRRVLSNPELLWFRGRGEQRRDFFTLWTLKESFYKYQGTGLPGFPNGTAFYFDGTWRLRGSGLFFAVFEEKGFLAAVCGEEEEVRLHRCGRTDSGPPTC